MKRLAYLLIAIGLAVGQEATPRDGASQSIQQWITSNGLEDSVANRDLNEKGFAGFVLEAQTKLALACDGSEAGKRACDFEDNLRAYTNYVNADQFCRVDALLSAVADPNADAVAIRAARDNELDAGALEFRGQDVFSFSNTPNQSIGAFELFGRGQLQSECRGIKRQAIRKIDVPVDSTAQSDKQILIYMRLMSEKTWEYNLPYVEATAMRIAEADARWKNFEKNVIHDQYPWETLLFNDWLAGSFKGFRGTLRHPPTKQIRALHPVPTGVLDVSGDESLFKPRITIEVLGIRHLDKTDYTARRGWSAIATLKSDDDESVGWGLLHTWKRGSLGVIYQEVADDDMVGLVFGIDLANQIDSKRNDLMTNWCKLRARVEQGSDEDCEDDDE